MAAAALLVVASDGEPDDLGVRSNGDHRVLPPLAVPASVGEQRLSFNTSSGVVDMVGDGTLVRL